MKPQAWPGGSCRAHAGSCQWGWLRTRWGWQLPWVPGACPHPDHYSWPQGLLTEENWTPHTTFAGTSQAELPDCTEASSAYLLVCPTKSTVCPWGCPRLQTAFALTSITHLFLLWYVSCRGELAEKSREGLPRTLHLDAELLIYHLSEATGTTLQLFASMCHAPPPTKFKQNKAFLSPCSPPVFLYWGLLYGEKAVRDGKR